MPFAVIVVGLVLLVSGARGTQDKLLSLVKNDFTGPSNYIYWLLPIIAVGLLGYVEKLRPLSHAFLALIIIGLFLNRTGFFPQFKAAIDTTVSPNVATGVTDQSRVATPDINPAIESYIKNVVN